MKLAPGTITLTWHRWRGFGIAKDLFVLFVNVGFVTIGVSQAVLEDELRDLRAALAKLKGDGK